MTKLDYGVPDDPEARLVTSRIREFMFHWLDWQGPLWFDFRNYNAAITVEVNFERRWWTIQAKNVGEISTSVLGIRNYLQQEKEEKLPIRAPDKFEISQTLKDRGATHGSFTENASVAQDTRTRWRAAKNWDKLRPAQQQCLDEIALKVARILSDGTDPSYTEHWHDIIGYATLGEQACSKTS